ncbi:MAG: DUF4129 domain-containing protein, partial [Pseudomonadota bacterium]|nr:DUF4129 domain-containing protein [Pseudomonadota bacterium]
MGGAEGHQAASAADRFAAAHRALRVDPTIQFTMGPVPKPAPPPQWLRDLAHWLERVLKPVGRFFDWIGNLLPDLPYARIVLWGLIGAVILAIVAMAYQRIRYGEWRLPRGRRRGVTQPDTWDEAEQWAPDAAPAREWLAEADALAAQG